MLAAAAALTAAFSLVLPTARVSAAPAATCTTTRVLLLSAYPAEAAANLSREELDPNQPQDVQGHAFYSGTLLGRPVIIGITGEGTKNGHDTTALALQHFSCISAVVMSGTAGGGGPAQLGDVSVPMRWTGDGGKTFAVVRPDLITRAEKIEAEADAQMETSAPLDDGPCGTATPPVVYLYRTPHLVIGGTGSTDNGGNPGTCSDAAGALAGCHPCPPADAPALPASPPALLPAGPARADLTTVTSGDEETAFAMAAATARGVPFIAFRAVSDDALPTPVWLGEYLAYQRLAADNAAAAARLWIRDWTPATTAPATSPGTTKPRKPTTTPPTATRPGGRLAATGAGTAVPMLGALLLLAAAAVRRRSAA
ncbi:MAG TPA: hypothetical protein VHE83_12985 [Mycobacteriales bacterium]|nr:hypothetical protein [Mycobacteriales bacterium]